MDKGCGTPFLLQLPFLAVAQLMLFLIFISLLFPLLSFLPSFICFCVRTRPELEARPHYPLCTLTHLLTHAGSAHLFQFVWLLLTFICAQDLDLGFSTSSVRVLVYAHNLESRYRRCLLLKWWRSVLCVCVECWRSIFYLQLQL